MPATFPSNSATSARVLWLAAALWLALAALPATLGVTAGSWLDNTAFAQADDDDDNDGDDDGDGDDAAGGGGAGPGGGGNDDVDVDDGENIGPRDDDDCFEEAKLLPPWLRRCDDRPRVKPKPKVTVSTPPTADDDADAQPATSATTAQPGTPAAPVALLPAPVATTVIGPEPPNALPREIVAAAATDADIAQLTARGFTIISRTSGPFPGGDMVRLRVPADLTTADARSLARQLAPDAIVDFNHIYRLAQAPCVTEVCRQREAIRWPTSAQACSVETAIGLVDTSVDASNPALAGQQIELINGVSGGRGQASFAHGTAIAALMVGRASATSPGLLPRSRIVVVQAFHRSASGEDVADTFDIAAAIDTVAKRSVSVANLSFTGPHNRVLAEVVRQTIAGGVPLVAAAGNLGPTGPVVYPAGYASVVAVTAVGTDLRVYRGANRGSHIDFSAPGVNVQVVAQQEATRFESGTSFAAPFVTAALAALRTRQPSQSIGELVTSLQAAATDLGRPGRDPIFGWGLVQIPEAICQ